MGVLSISDTVPTLRNDPDDEDDNSECVGESSDESGEVG